MARGREPGRHTQMLFKSTVAAPADTDGRVKFDKGFSIYLVGRAGIEPAPTWTDARLAVREANPSP